MHFLKQTLELLGSQGNLLEWITALGTAAASIVAIYFGAIQPRFQYAKFKVLEVKKATSYSVHDITYIQNRSPDLLEIGFMIKQTSGKPSRNVNVLVKKVFFWEKQEDGTLQKSEWDGFVPSNLKWAANDSSFARGVVRYCHFGVWGDPYTNDHIGAVFNIITSENKNDPIYDAFSAMLPRSKKYEIELMISGENAKVSEFCVRMELNDRFDDENIVESVKIELV